MIKRGLHPQTTALNVWSVGMPDGSRKGRPLAAYDTNGDSLEIDSWSLENDVLHVNFGIDPVAGELEYEYQVEGNENVVVDTSGNQVSITINQYGGGASTDTFQ
ncbi:hypothetical protein CHOED_02 [Vibrio phage CHOED]|uniref:hypothetical protein n=1 Tax=Vibrio phage CHOED TaxID=1458716 RepID=UPI00042E6068|nr:hypothetical protein CHOED_02 [Vibrio phage CHOED]AHK11862.1 hypothetical protein CHOED_02 [Vibrio phage CHOED]